ncbi:MAG TPA: DUF2254 domain-containing protein [Gammaproteobacteria bacterium]
MKLRLARNFEKLNSSYWFFPSLLVAGAIVAASGMIYLDWISQTTPLFENHFFEVSPSGARELLSMVGSSAISVAGVVFSITMLVLSMSSAQFGPQILGNFMQHRGTQIVLGTFVGTFVYCLIVLSAVRNDRQLLFVPNLAVGLGLVLGILSFSLLVYFIHHVSIFVRASHVIHDVGSRMEAAVNHAFPERCSDGKAPDKEFSVTLEKKLDSKGYAVKSIGSGYLQVVDWDALCGLAVQRNLVMKVDYRPGHYVIEGSRLMKVLPAESITDKDMMRICDAVLLGSERIYLQDPEFAVHQLVQVALRALSSGINDPYTAINCMDRLSAALAHLAGRQLPSRYLRDRQGNIRIIKNPLTYGGIVDAAFDQLRQQAAGNAAPTFRLLEVAATLGEQDLPVPFREVLKNQIYAIGKLNESHFTDSIDQEDFRERYRRALQTVARGSLRVD